MGANKCEEWTGRRSPKGYGLVYSNGRTIRAHRLKWELTFGPIPQGMCVLHRCDNPPCVNPRHLFLGTLKDNTHDCIAKRRQGWQRDPERFRALGKTRGGENNGRHKLTAAQVSEIRAALNQGIQQKILARQYGVGVNAIWHIAHGHHWKAPEEIAARVEQRRKERTL